MECSVISFQSSVGASGAPIVIAIVILIMITLTA